MAIIEETVFLSVLNESFTYSLSNDLEEIKKAINLRTGIGITNIVDFDWKINTRLAKETKNLMNKYNVSFSTASRIEDDEIYIVINRRIQDTYYLYSGQTINGYYFVNNEPEFTRLSKDILNTIKIEEIIYAEYLEPGAMDNIKGLLLFIIIDGKLHCYETDFLSDNNTYEKAVSEIVSNSILSRYSNVKNDKGIFNFYRGKFDNTNIFINKNIDLNIGNGYFYYINNGKVYYLFRK
jgi:hypothetical protein